MSHGQSEYSVLLQKDGMQSIEFKSQDDMTVLESARKNAVFMANYCRQGGCGACTAKLVSGSAEYIRQVKGAPQRPELGDDVRPCSLLAKSDLILEPLSRWQVNRD